MNEIITKHKLDFECTPYKLQIKGESLMVDFRVGTCHGLYTSTDKSYDIIAITNREKGNGHFEDVVEWFENSCRRDKKSLRFVEIMNDGFKTHLVNKRCFLDIGEDNVEKNLHNEL